MTANRKPIRKPGSGSSSRRQDHKLFRFIPTLSWDSVTVLLGLAISGFLYVQTIKNDQMLQGKEIANVQKSVDRVEQQQAKDIANVQKAIERAENDMKERNKHVVEQTKDRADRLEQLIKDSTREMRESLKAIKR